MTAKSYCRLAALIFAVVAASQLIRAVNGWPITVVRQPVMGKLGRLHYCWGACLDWI